MPPTPEILVFYSLDTMNVLLNMAIYIYLFADVLENLNWKVFLNYPSEPNVFTSLLMRGKPDIKGRRVSRDRGEVEVGVMQTEDWRKGYEARNAGEKGEEVDSLLEPSEGIQL